MCQIALQATSSHTLGGRLAMEVSVLGTWVVAFPNNSFCRDKVEYTVTEVMNQEAFVI